MQTGMTTRRHDRWSTAVSLSSSIAIEALEALEAPEAPEALEAQQKKTIQLKYNANAAQTRSSKNQM